MTSAPSAGSASSSAAARHGESLADLQRRLSYLSMAIDHTLSDPHHHRTAATSRSTSSVPSDTAKASGSAHYETTAASPPPTRPARSAMLNVASAPPSAVVVSPQPFVVDAAHRSKSGTGLQMPAAATSVSALPETENRCSSETASDPGRRNLGALRNVERIVTPPSSSHTYQRIESEKRELVEHQRRLLELDLERQALEERRAALASARSTLRARSLSQASSHASGSTMVSRSAPSSRSPSPAAVAVPRIGLSESPHHLSRSWGSNEQVQSQVDTVPFPHDTRSRHSCRLHLQDVGLEILVLTGKDTAIECQLFLSSDVSELIAIPRQQQQQQPPKSVGLSADPRWDGRVIAPPPPESHHFPLLNAAVLYPNGVVQHHWMPKRVHVRGIVVGNRARSILIAKGFPYIASPDGRHRHRLYFVVGGDAYAEESTLLVVQTANRVAWLTLVLGIHEAMWPDGKPTLTRGRALWLHACHAVMQQYWEANELHETVFQTSQRRLRCRSKDAAPTMRGSSDVLSAKATPQPPPSPATLVPGDPPPAVLLFSSLGTEPGGSATPSARFSVPNIAAKASSSSTPPPSPRVTFVQGEQPYRAPATDSGIAAASQVPVGFRQGKGPVQRFLAGPHGTFTQPPVGSQLYQPCVAHPSAAMHQPGTFFPRTSSGGSSRRPLTAVVQYNY